MVHIYPMILYSSTNLCSQRSFVHFVIFVHKDPLVMIQSHDSVWPVWTGIWTCIPAQRGDDQQVVVYSTSAGSELFFRLNKVASSVAVLAQPPISMYILMRYCRTAKKTVNIVDPDEQRALQLHAIPLHARFDHSNVIAMT